MPDFQNLSSEDKKKLFEEFLKSEPLWKLAHWKQVVDQQLKERGCDFDV